MVYLRLRPYIPDEPIVQHLSDTDFYKYPMNQFIFNHFGSVRARFGFKNRSKVPLARIIPKSRLREELDHVRTLRYTNTELHYIRGTYEYGARMFTDPFIDALKDYKAPDYDLEYRGDDIRLEFDGLWKNTSPWEMPGLEIINELYFRELTKNHSPFQRDAALALGKRNLHEKIRILKQNPQIVFSEFGTRRRFSRDWQDYVVAALAEELGPQQFRGTSNVFLAQKHGLLPMGTNAHELQMVIAGLRQSTDISLRGSVLYMLELWWQQYGEPLSIFLPDTYGSESFLASMTEELLRKWKGFRQDSGDPIAEGEMWIKIYKKFGIDPRKKMMICSDGQDLGTMLKIEKHFRGRLMVSFGWGTNLTNDLGFGTLSLVIKALEADGIGLVKLSNNPAKALGHPMDVARYISVFHYKKHKRMVCKY